MPGTGVDALQGTAHLIYSSTVLYVLLLFLLLKDGNYSSKLVELGFSYKQFENIAYSHRQ